MITSPKHAGRRRSIIAATASVVLALVGAVILFMGTRSSDGPPQPPADAAQSFSASSAPTPVGSPITGQRASPSLAVTNKAGGADFGPILTASPPVSIDIPSIGVRTSNIVDLGRAANGSLQAPQDFAAVGWYTAGPSPGQLGPAVLAGHVDSHNGPAIFYRLGALRPGARVSVRSQRPLERDV